MFISIEAEKAFNKIEYILMMNLSANYEQKECSQLDKENINKKKKKPNAYVDLMHNAKFAS